MPVAPGSHPDSAPSNGGSRSLFRCPACGKGRLFSGFLTIADSCSACGLPLKHHEQGDGPAFFGILIVGTLAAIGATVVQVRYAPPFWVDAMIWVPFVLVGSLVSLRFLKAALVHAQYRYRKDDFTT